MHRWARTLPNDVIWRYFSLKHVYLSKLDHFVISRPIIVQFITQRYPRVQFTQWFPLKQEINRISDTCEFPLTQIAFKFDLYLNRSESQLTRLTFNMWTENFYFQHRVRKRHGEFWLPLNSEKWRKIESTGGVVFSLESATKIARLRAAGHFSWELQ